MLNCSLYFQQRRRGATSPVVVVLLAGILIALTVLIVVLLMGRNPSSPPQSSPDRSASTIPQTLADQSASTESPAQQNDLHKTGAAASRATQQFWSQLRDICLRPKQLESRQSGVSSAPEVISVMRDTSKLIEGMAQDIRNLPVAGIDSEVVEFSPSTSLYCMKMPPSSPSLPPWCKKCRDWNSTQIRLMLAWSRSFGASLAILWGSSTNSMNLRENWNAAAKNCASLGYV